MSSHAGSTPSSDSERSGHLNILQVGTYDVGGGAERVALNLLRSYRSRGLGSWLAVGHRRTQEPGVLQIPNEAAPSPWQRAWSGLGAALEPSATRVRLMGDLRNLSLRVARPLKTLDDARGYEDFGFPGTWRLLELTPEPASVVHCHNLHGGYFDLRALPSLSRRVPTVLTLHDAWLLSGHCAHSFDCTRWRTGCGQCPDLTIYPSIRRDGTAHNWQRKERIFDRSRVYVATPSQWLMDKVEQSMLAPAVVEARVIPNGVDLSAFHPADRRSVRARLAIPHDAAVLLFAANGIRRNPWKDFETLRSVLAAVAERMNGRRLLFVALGEDSPTEEVGGAELRFVPFETDPTVAAQYFQAADVYVHAARADTFPNTVVEALACGTPVVATAVGGIPEQVKHATTGFLIPPASVAKMTDAVVTLLDDERLRRFMAANAAEDARQRFDLERQVDDYIDWYGEILASRPAQ
jgi:glycosyltransferase involved in cell wall biosynthesis